MVNINFLRNLITKFNIKCHNILIIDRKDTQAKYLCFLELLNVMFW